MNNQILISKSHLLLFLLLLQRPELSLSDANLNTSVTLSKNTVTMNPVLDSRDVEAVTQTPTVPALHNVSCQPLHDRVIRVAILLPGQKEATDPHDLSTYNKLESVLPAVELATRSWYTNITNKSALGLSEVMPDWSLEVYSGDTHCSSTFGPLKAFDLHCVAGRQLFLKFHEGIYTFLF